MLQHFQYKPLYKEKRIPGWSFSFYFSGKRMEGVYHKNGRIEWKLERPVSQYETALEKQVHDLMLFHVYDQQR